MELAKLVIYIDAQGKEHDALVTNINQRHEGFISVAYVADGLDGMQPVRFAYDIAHTSDPSRQEIQGRVALGVTGHPVVEQGNANLPTYHLNCWKEVGAEHSALPSDHPAFDTAFAWPKADEHGVFPVVSRPAFEAHQKQWAAYMKSQEAAALPSADDLDADASDKEAAAATSGALAIETKEYSDGSSATGVAPLPNLSPAQQDAAAITEKPNGRTWGNRKKKDQ